MTSRITLLFPALLAVVSLPLAAADVSGKWSGTLTTGSSRDHQESFSLELKVSGSDLTGALSAPREPDYPIQKGHVDGNRVTFDIVPKDDELVHFDLTLEGDTLKGPCKYTSKTETEMGDVELKLVASVSLPSAAADVSGKWSGTIASRPSADGKKDSVNLELKVSGSNLTGTVSVPDELDLAIQKGHVDGNHVTFDITPKDDELVHFDLILEGDTLKGPWNYTSKTKTEMGDIELKKLAAVSLPLANLSGKWSGTMTERSTDRRQHSVSLELKVSGSNLTGTASAPGERDLAIQTGHVDGNHVTFDIIPSDGAVIHFDLTLDAATLKGPCKYTSKTDTQMADVELKLFADVSYPVAATDVNGKWSGTLTTGPTGSHEERFNLEFKVSGSALTGTLSAGDRDLPIQQGHVDGNHVRFDVAAKDDTLVHFDLTIEGDTLKGPCKSTSKTETEIGHAELKRM